MAKKKKERKVAPIKAPVTILPSKGKNAKGRPSIFSEELARDICHRLMDGESLRNICKSDDMPNIDTIMTWLHDKKDFSEQYARARRIQATQWAEECIDLSDEAYDGDSSSAQRLKVDTRKWIASKLYPKVWGDHGSGFDTSKTDGGQDVAARAVEILGRIAERKSGGGESGGENSGGI